ncbi:serine/threonine-protein kinase rio1 [Holotrichia oblita]|uniref:Serine/threonine-protein kinase rio1 n=1 Tax=Holotrichia oblita TaxID=644536 RepID=A0ACB9SL67_HOLOL|nr:serine/threonine-protein kinase rio1 [Holotrichia oblita]
MSSPWGKIAVPDPVNLQDIMSEELARDLQEKENRKCNPPEPIKDEFEIPPELLQEDELLKSDEEIARMLQQQFDKEYDDNLKRSEEKFNGASKVAISFSNYRRAPLNLDFDSESEPEELEDIRDKKDWDRFDTVMREFHSIPACGYKKENGSMVTKHDVNMSARKNVCKMMSFPPEFETGDGAGFDMKISNKVFNRMHDKKEDRETAIFGIDAKTRIILYKMINNELLDRVNGVISIGKEAVVLHADTNPDYPECPLPKECAIKVFKTTLSEYKQRDKYIRDDYRFKDRFGKTGGKISTLKLVQLWAEKEMHNLNRLQSAGVLCPQVIALKKHVLVMSFIGDQNKAAPKLKDAILDDVKIMMAYEQIMEYMKLMYNECNLIHADFSEYNILWYDDNCYVIDVSQAVEPSHENAFHFLYRDCENVSNFFYKRDVPNVISPDKLFKNITGYDYSDKIALVELQESTKMKPHLAYKPGVESSYNFDNAWEKSKTGRLPDQCSSSIEDLNFVEPLKA